MKKYIKIQFNMPGFHFWKKAPTQYSFLRNKHRHMFYWTVVVSVKDSDREIEFIDLKDWFMHFLKEEFGYLTGENQGFLNKHLDFGGLSCENIAQATHDLVDKIDCDLMSSEQIKSIEVLEDNENGALIEFGD